MISKNANKYSTATLVVFALTDSSLDDRAAYVELLYQRALAGDTDAIAALLAGAVDFKLTEDQLTDLSF